MSIQSSINQGVSIASLLYTQTPKFKEQKLNREVNKIEKASESVAKSELKSGRKGAGIDAFSALQKGQEDIARAAEKSGNYEKKYQAEKKAKTFANITEGMRLRAEQANMLSADKSNQLIQQSEGVKQRFSLARELREQNPILLEGKKSNLRYSDLNKEQQKAVQKQLKGTSFERGLKEKLQNESK